MLRYDYSAILRKYKTALYMLHGLVLVVLDGFYGLGHFTFCMAQFFFRLCGMPAHIIMIGFLGVL